MTSYKQILSGRNFGSKREAKREQFGESVVKQNKLFKGGDLT